MLRCPDCSCEMSRRNVVIRIGDIDGWSCVSCKTFYKIKDLKKAILTV